VLGQEKRGSRDWGVGRWFKWEVGGRLKKNLWGRGRRREKKSFKQNQDKQGEGKERWVGAWGEVLKKKRVIR